MGLLVLRLVLVNVAMLLTVNLDMAFGHGAYNVREIKDSALFGHSFLNLTDEAMHMGKCLATCLQNCRCMSFQLCQDNVCQLCSSNKHSHPSDFKPAPECMYFLFDRSCEETPTAVQGSCQTGINCCLSSSNPCLNGGVCESTIHHVMNGKPRFRCKCAPQYTGELCENLIRSCRTYARGKRVPGIYQVANAETKEPYEVFCDFDADSPMTWTLVQSFALEQALRVMPLVTDYPLQQYTPRFDTYRLSRSQMLSIQGDSTTKWRVTCRYDTDGVQYVDYMRGTISALDILNYNSGFGACIDVEYVNIRGYNCSACTAGIFNFGGSWGLHVDACWSAAHCTFKPEENVGCIVNFGEDDFGYYIIINNQHRCSSSASSTTQIWLGGQ